MSFQWTIPSPWFSPITGSPIPGPPIPGSADQCTFYEITVNQITVNQICSSVWHWHWDNLNGVKWKLWDWETGGIGGKEHERAEKCQLHVSAIHLNFLMEQTRDSQVLHTWPVSNTPSISLFKVSFSHVNNDPDNKVS